MNARFTQIHVFAWFLCAGSIFFAAESMAQQSGARVVPRVITFDAPPSADTNVTVKAPGVTGDAKPAERQFLTALDEEAAALPLLAPRAETLPEKTESPLETQAGNLWKTLSPGASENVGTAVPLILLLAVLSLAPAILLMATCFVRIVVVLGILRQGLAAQGLPSTQVITALALFMTFFIMYPVGKEIYTTALEPYQNQQISGKAAWDRGVQPLRGFMYKQIVLTKNTDDIRLFWSYSASPPKEADMERSTQEDIPLEVLVPAFMLSELKTAFLIGVQLLLPMLVIDLLVSAVLVSMGMYMLPPLMISLPLKLLVFVMADGWRLVVEMLLRSFGG